MADSVKTANKSNVIAFPKAKNKPWYDFFSDKWNFDFKNIFNKFKNTDNVDMAKQSAKVDNLVSLESARKLKNQDVLIKNGFDNQQPYYMQMASGQGMQGPTMMDGTGSIISNVDCGTGRDVSITKNDVTSNKIKEVDIRAYRGLKDSDVLARVLGRYEADPRLTIDMPYIGKGSSTANAEGWLRDSNYYWNKMLERHPEAFSQFNRSIIGGSHPTLSTPVNDATFRGYFTQYDVTGLRGTTLVHHHIGGGGQAVAIPKPLHPGFGGIHNAEKNLGIWGSDSKYAEILQIFLEE